MESPAFEDAFAHCMPWRDDPSGVMAAPMSLTTKIAFVDRPCVDGDGVAVQHRIGEFGAQTSLAQLHFACAVEAGVDAA